MLNSIQIKSRYNKLNAQLITLAAQGKIEQYNNIKAKIRTLKNYAALRGFYTGAGSFLYK